MKGVRPREERTAAGVVFMVLAALFFTCIDTSAKWLNIAGFPVIQIVFARYAGHLIFALVFYLPQEGLAAFRSNAPAKQALRSCFLFGSTMINFQALKFLPITVTTTIAFAQPIVITVLAIPILKEKVGLRRFIAVLVGFLGVLVVIQPWSAEFHPAMFLSLAVLTLASMYFIMTRMLAGIENDATQQIWPSLTATVVLAPFVLQLWVWPDTPVDWFVLCAIGAFGAIGHIFTTVAHRWADASILAPVIYTQLFAASLVGIFIFHTWPTVWTLAGAAIIIGSGIYIWHRETRVKPRS
ncbi:DMT family transporter [Sulfitobacter sp. LCG007]